MLRRLLVILVLFATAIVSGQTASAAQYSAGTVSYQVHPQSPGPGVYCIPDKDVNVSVGGIRDPSRQWKNFVPRGFWADQVSNCWTYGGNPLQTDTDGFWIDINHHATIHYWTGSAWAFNGACVNGNDGTYFAKVPNTRQLFLVTVWDGRWC